MTESTPYTILNEIVVKETDLSDYQRSEKLHTLPALGDQRPSDLLASIRNLQPVQDCSRYQFLSRMPPITRAQLVNQKDLTVDELAALADTIMLSQASVQSVLAEVDADHHNAEVLRKRPSASASPTPVKEKQVFDLSTNLPTEAGINLAALQAAQMTDADAAQLSRMKGFSFSFVMFKEIK